MFKSPWFIPQGLKPALLKALNGTDEAVLFHGSSNIVVAPDKSCALTNVEVEILGTKGIPPLRVGMTRTKFFRKL